MPLILSASSASDALRAFHTYLNYLSAVEQWAMTEFGSWRRYGDACVLATRRLQGIRDPDMYWVGRFLKLAWNTEFLLHASDTRDPEIQRLNNHWAPVQAYYAIYCGCEAVAYLLDGERANSHSKALRKVTEYFGRSGITPWNIVVAGPIGRTRNEASILNLPHGVVIPHNLQRRGVDPLGMIAKCVPAEHRNRVDENWSKKTSGCRKYQFDPGDTSLLHFLYRLRVKANYRDVDIFLAHSDDEEVIRFGRALRFVTNAALMYLELIAIRKARKRPVLDLGAQYLRSNHRAAALEQRLEYYRGAI